MSASTTTTTTKPAAPRTLIETVKRSKTLFLTLRESLVNNAGEWEIKRKGSDRMRVWIQKTRDTSAWRNGAMMYFSGVDPSKVFLELSCYDRRMKWDASFEFTKIVQQYRDDHDVVLYTTKKALGGVIKPRIFVDCRQMTSGKDKAGRTDFLNCCCAAPAAKTISQTFKINILGTNLPGGGLSVRPAPKHLFSSKDVVYEIVLIGQSELGGWLPYRITNEPTVDAYEKILAGIAKRIEDAWGGVVHPFPVSKGARA